MDAYYHIARRDPQGFRIRFMAPEYRQRYLRGYDTGYEDSGHGRTHHYDAINYYVSKRR
jgi:hypothetical protein